MFEDQFLDENISEAEVKKKFKAINKYIEKNDRK